MKIVLEDVKKPVKVRAKEYPAEERRILDTYFAKLVRMGFLKTCSKAPWPAASHLVAKHSKSKVSSTIDLRPVNDAAKTKHWPMPGIEAELKRCSQNRTLANAWDRG